MQASADFGRRAFIRPHVGRASAAPGFAARQVGRRPSIVVTLDNFTC